MTALTPGEYVASGELVRSYDGTVIGAPEAVSSSGEMVFEDEFIIGVRRIVEFDLVLDISSGLGGRSVTFVPTLQVTKGSAEYLTDGNSAVMIPWLDLVGWSSTIN